VKNSNILISGASIAGPALAFWLRRRGFNPTVVERPPGPRPGGQAVDLRGAGREAAERMGIMGDVRRAHTGVRGVAFVDAANRRKVTMPADLFGDSGGIVAEVEILRGDLVRILYSATRDDVEYLFDDSITGLAQPDHGVEVTFEGAAPRVFDLVVGADGLRSTVRALAFGPESEFVRDLGFHLAIFGAPTRGDLDGWELMYNAPPGRMVGLYPVRDHAEARAMFFFASPPREHDRRDVGQQKRLLAETFAGVGWEVPRLLEAMWEAPDFYFDRASRVQMTSWSSGRAVLLGDAAYGGSVGMGTSMALVGAYVLAGELAGAAGDHRTGFARYESEMRDYVAQNLKPMPGGVRGFLPGTRLEVWLRNQFMRMLPYLPSKGPMGGIEKAANAITLEDYPAIAITPDPGPYVPGHRR
jgi:2-polyprenyl-6-methoxyphenol hydroxylase-like FAD-dependent oxidoreductase